MKIALRTRKLKDGRETVYLDKYHKGKRQLEYLGLYLVGNSKLDKETLRLAEAIRAKRQLESVADEHDLPSPSRLKEDFVAFCRRIGESQKALNTQLVWQRAIAKLIAFRGETITFAQIDERFLEDFRQFLLKDLKRNSAAAYFSKIKHAIRQAVRKRILQRNPSDGISISPEETDRVFLTLAELRALEKTPCDNRAVKDAFLFSAFCGLRYSDVKRLSWENVTNEGKHWLLGFRQKKTNSPEWMPLSAEAAAIVQRQKDARPSEKIENPVPEDAVFKLPAQQTIDKALKRWAIRAGVEKRISFHTGRHTFATLGLKHGIDIYTMSKLLGHKTLEATQIYAKVVDESKRKAVAMLPRLNGEE